MFDSGGQLEIFPTTLDRRRFAYFMTPKGIAAKAALTGKLLIRTMGDYEALKLEIEDVTGDLTAIELATLSVDLKTQSLHP